MMRALLLFWLAWSASAAQWRMRDGKTLEGAPDNVNLTIHAAYGSVTIPVTNLARIQFGAAGQPDAAVTRNANRLSGFINDTLRLGDRQFHKGAIDRIDFAAPNAGPAPGWIVLRNGDLLAGTPALPPLPEVAADRVHSIWFERGSPRARVQTADGKEIAVGFEPDSIAVALELGVEIVLSRELVKVIYPHSGAGPPESFQLTRVETNPSAPPAAAPAGLVWIEPGQVLLGSPLDEPGRNSDEGPQMVVTIARGFWMGRCEVTQGEYRAVMGQNPSTFQGDTNRPVEKVNWHEAMEYCARLTDEAREKEILPNGYVYRLPTEAEWEYACRAGTGAPYSFGAGSAERELPAHAWYAANGGWSTHPVGQLKPNAWGLHDMHGNVLEWCLGLWSDSYPGGRVTDYNGPSEGWLRVARGGSWLYGAAFARCANRDDYGPGNRCSDLGFRVVLAPPMPAH